MKKEKEQINPWPGGKLSTNVSFLREKEVDPFKGNWGWQVKSWELAFQSTSYRLDTEFRYFIVLTR